MSYKAHLLRKSSSKGFGLPPSLPEPSPFAELLLGKRDDLPRRSRLTLGLIKRDLFDMGKNSHFISDPVYQKVVARTMRRFQLPESVYPIHLNDVMQLNLDIWKSSPGIPWSEMGYKTRGEVVNDTAARNSIKYLWHRVKCSENIKLPDCKVLYRAHLEKDRKPKIRAVYGYPTTVTLAEAQFAIPLIEAYKEAGTTPIAYGYDMALGGASRLRRELTPHKNIACFDFSSFDKTVSEQLIRDAFLVLTPNLDLRKYRGRGTPRVDSLMRVWEHLVDYFVETTMRLPTGERYQKFAGVPSGSYFTQLIDSIVNYILIAYAAEKLGNSINYARVFGDDSVVAFAKPINIFHFAELFDSIGMKLNMDKSIVTNNVDEVEFLGFGIAYGFPRRTYDTWLSALYNPERNDQTWDDFASRALGLFYANHGVDGQFDHLCRRIVKFAPFAIRTSREFDRFLKNIGIDPRAMSAILPDKVSLLFSLIG